MLFKKQNTTPRECNCMQLKESILMSENLTKLDQEKYLQKKSVSLHNCTQILRTMGGSLLVAGPIINQMFKLE